MSKWYSVPVLKLNRLKAMCDEGFKRNGTGAYQMVISRPEKNTILFSVFCGPTNKTSVPVPVIFLILKKNHLYYHDFICDFSNESNRTITEHSLYPNKTTIPIYRSYRVLLVTVHFGTETMILVLKIAFWY